MGTNGAYPEEYSETQSSTESITRERLPLNEGWRFKKYESTAEADDLIYDLRPNSDTPVYTDRTGLEGDAPVLKAWILPNQDEPGEILLTATGEYLRGQSVVISSHEK